MPGAKCHLVRFDAGLWSHIVHMVHGSTEAYFTDRKPGMNVTPILRDHKDKAKSEGAEKSRCN